ncbi:alpha-amylase family glycosyl hydrolase [Paenibacillus sp. GCM10023252]|uniref:alpha-amylase family glycosyl hydrolase n=1 Tax=Paenibacillus sp. GCM10023252 TaxID=3252649 RepID=UPI00360DF2FC
MMIQVMLGAALLPTGASAAAGAIATAAADTWQGQPGGLNKWFLVGALPGQTWKQDAPEYQFTHLVDGFYAYSVVLEAGTYPFKIVKNGTWDGYSNNGGNFSMTLTEQTKVTFYVNDKLGQARISIPDVEGLTPYTPQLADDKQPRLVGDIQAPVFGETNWSPETAKQLFVDYNFDGSVYKLQRTIPAGSYNVKAAFGPNWNESYGAKGGSDLALKVLDESAVIFTVDYSAADRFLTHNYQPKDGAYDGQIDKTKLSFDSRQLTYRKPFGAIKQLAQDLTLRIAAGKNDVQLAKVELTSGDGLSKTYNMIKATTIGELDYYETTIPKSVFDTIGIWGYKFILIDGGTKVEYGDDGVRGGTGAAAAEGALPYDLTVYATDYKTPDWMKNAIVYQIFPDRFLDGDKTNNRAKLKDGVRGVRNDNGTNSPITSTPIQYFDGGVPNDPAASQVEGDWSDVPENPRRILPENSYNFPGATSDGVFTNEFYGGDIAGIEQKLDYLKSLGVTALYLNPVAWAASNHKYDATDYKHLDPMFGKPVYNTPGDPLSGLNYDETREASDGVFKAFAKAARAEGMALITDGVFNHVGDDSIYFDRYEKYPEIGAYEFWAKVWDKVNAGASEADAKAEVIASYTAKTNPATGVKYAYPDDFDYIGWFTVENKKVADDSGKLRYKYEAWWGYDSLPAMDAKEPEAGDTKAIQGLHEWNLITYRDEVIGYNLEGLSDDKAAEVMQSTASQRWMWMGAQGWRLDVAPDVTSGTWKKFREAVKSTAGRTNGNGEEILDPIILGEEWGVATHYLLGDQFDSVMNYRFRGALQSYMISGNAAAMNAALESIREDYPQEAWLAMLNLVGSHDTTRNITKLDHPNWEEENLKIAPAATEKALKLQGLTAILQMGYPGAPTIYYGDELGLEGTKDPDSRRTFPWDRVSGSAGSYEGVGRHAELFNTYTQAGKVRTEHEVFRTGDLKTAYAKDDVIVYARTNGAEAGLVVVNRSETEQQITADVTGFLPAGLTLKDEVYGTAEAQVGPSGKISLTIPALTGYLMVSQQPLVNVPKVEGLAATGGNGKVSLSWQPVSGAVKYNVYRSAMEGAALTLAGTVDAPTVSYTDSGVVNGTKQYYAVTAVIGDAESAQPDSMASATPAYEVAGVELVTPAADLTIGVGKTTSEIEVAVDVPGLTDDAAYTGKEAAGLTARLFYYDAAAGAASAADVKLRFKRDAAGGKKVYYGVFEPTAAGEYHYYAKVSTNNGESYTDSAEAVLNAAADGSDTTAPVGPELGDILQESNRAALGWTLGADDTVKGLEVYRKAEGESAFTKLAVLGAEARAYIDYTVSNDVSYTYKVAAFDGAYNRTDSGEKSVTPKVVMVDVKLRLHLPSYTPATDDIYLAGDLNGWNASGNKLNVPSGATSRDVVEYSFRMMAGKQIQYKYTRGSWSTEAFSSHTRKADDTEDYGNWAYSSTDTNMRLTISNQGGNQMIVDDYVLRWVDMPMAVTLPRSSFGEDIEYTTDQASVKLKAVVPYGVLFTINGEPIKDEEMDEYGNVLVDALPLKSGLNTFELHIEPTAETLAQPWYTDKGRAGQATKTVMMRITRTGGEVDLGDGGGDGGTGGNNGGNNGGNGENGENNGSAGTKLEVTVVEQNKTIIGSVSKEAWEAAWKLAVAAAGEGGTGGAGGTGGTGGTEGTEGTDGKPLLTAVFDQAGERYALELPAGILKEAAAAGAVVVVKTPLGSYELPLAGISGKVLKKLYKKDVPLDELKVVISLGKADGKTEDKMKASVKKAGASLLGSPVKFDVTVDWKGDKKEVSDFDGVYVTRLLAVDSESGNAADSSSANDQSGKSGNGADSSSGNDADSKGNENVFGAMFDPVTEQWSYVPTELVTSADGKLSAALKRPGNSIYALLEREASFADSKQHWARAEIEWIASRMIVEGRRSEEFAPEAAVTRAEFAAMLVRALGLEGGLAGEGAGATGFTDVKAGAWYEGAVATASRFGLVQGKSAEMFSPNDRITREELAVMLSRAAKLAGAELGSAAAGDGSSQPFKDHAAISAWARAAVDEAAKAGILKGNPSGLFEPQGEATRAETAVMLTRWLKAAKLG